MSRVRRTVLIVLILRNVVCCENVLDVNISISNIYIAFYDDDEVDALSKTEMQCRKLIRVAFA